MVLDYVALAILIFLILFFVWIALKLGALPGKIAASRSHPYTDAVRVSGWLGLLTLGILWPLALIWSYTSTVPDEPPTTDSLAENEAAESTEPSVPETETGEEDA